MILSATKNPETSSSNLTEPMEGIEMEEVDEETSVEEGITLINVMGSANKVNAKDARQLQDKP